MPTMTTRRALATGLLAAVLSLALPACEPLDNECPEGTVQTDDDMQVVCVEPDEAAPVTPDESNEAAERADAVREQQFDDCRADGKSEEDCLAEGGAP